MVTNTIETVIKNEVKAIKGLQNLRKLKDSAKESSVAVRELNKENNKLKALSMRQAKAISNFKEKLAIQKTATQDIAKESNKAARKLKAFGVTEDALGKHVDSSAGSIMKLADGYEVTQKKAKMMNDVLKKVAPQFEYNAEAMKFQHRVIENGKKGLKNYKGATADLTLAQRNMLAQKMAPHIKKINKQVGLARTEFQGWAMSLLFGGMVIQKAFQSIMQSGVKTFMDLSTAQNGLGGSILMLQASFQTLSFTIGSALATVLDSLLPTILPIIEAVTDWVSEHKKLTAALIIGGFIFGTFLLLLGQAVLFGAGFIKGLEIMGKGVSWFFNILKTGSFAGFLTGIENAKTAMISFAKNVKDNTVAMLKNIKTFVISAFKWMLMNPWVLWIGSILLLGFVLFALKGKFGTWGNALKVFVSGFLLAITAIVGIAADAIMLPLKLVGKAIAKLMEGYNKIAGLLGMKMIPTGIIDGLKKMSDIASITKKSLEAVSVALDKAGMNPEAVNEGSMWENFKAGVISTMPTAEDIQSLIPVTPTEIPTVTTEETTSAQTNTGDIINQTNNIEMNLDMSGAIAQTDTSETTRLTSILESYAPSLGVQLLPS